VDFHVKPLQEELWRYLWPEGVIIAPVGQFGAKQCAVMLADKVFGTGVVIGSRNQQCIAVTT